MTVYIKPDLTKDKNINFIVFNIMLNRNHFTKFEIINDLMKIMECSYSYAEKRTDMLLKF